MADPTRLTASQLRASVYQVTVRCILILTLSLLVPLLTAEAQQAGKVPRVGMLSPGSSSEALAIQREPFERGLRELGWMPGSNIVIEYRYGEGSTARVATLDDVIRRRTFTVDAAEVNRQHGEGPAWFATSCPASLGCRIAGLAQPELLVEVEVAALKGAGANIGWIAPDEVDPLDER